MITLYSTGCPKCEILKKRLIKDNIEFNVSDDVDKMVEMGFQNAPILDTDGTYREFSDAMKWLRTYEELRKALDTVSEVDK